MSSGGIVNRITRPEDCVLGFGIPTTLEEFRVRHDDPRSFACGINEREYYKDVLIPFRKLAGQIRKLGAHLVTDLTLYRYASLFEDRRTHAVILFSHWGGDFIELQDGPVGFEAFLQTVPDDFPVILDFCVCHPDEWIPRLRESRPLCPMPHIQEKGATPLYWLHFYRDLFRCLRSGSRPYVSTSEELAAAYERSWRYERERRSAP